MDQRNYQEILDAAIQSEIEANLFYHDVAGKVTQPYLKDMFLKFADEELKHRRILEGFKSKPDAAIRFAHVPDLRVSETIEHPVLSTQMKPADAIALAMKKEEEAMRHYTLLAESCNDMEQRKIFTELAAMEREHKARMENAFVDIGYPEVW